MNGAGWFYAASVNLAVNDEANTAVAESPVNQARLAAFDSGNRKVYVAGGLPTIIQSAWQELKTCRIPLSFS